MGHKLETVQDSVAVWTRDSLVARTDRSVVGDLCFLGEPAVSDHDVWLVSRVEVVGLSTRLLFM